MTLAVTLIEADGLTVRRGGSVVLDTVHLSIAPGEIVTVVGPNGSGKSTLVRALIGLERAAAGRVDRRPGLRIGYVPQRLHIDSALPMTVLRFLSLGARATASEALGALARVGVAAPARSQQMVSLSGGQFQRVLLARALLARPDVLILDEPTQGLDQPGVAAFYRLIADVRDETGCAVVMVSHDLNVVMAASDRVLCLNRHVCCEGTPEVVSAAPEYRALFGLGAGGTMALYRHDHDHEHDGASGQADGPGYGRGHGHDPGHDRGAHDAGGREPVQSGAPAAASSGTAARVPEKTADG